MENFFSHPPLIYVVSTVACLCIMIIVDYHLGPVAQHLNAWSILTQMIGSSVSVPESKAVAFLGLWGAATLAIILNAVFGLLFIPGIKQLLKIF